MPRDAIDLPAKREKVMPNNLRHFAIECDDVERARAFYEKVFGWRIQPWGPPGFYQIFTGTAEAPGVLGALQGRRHASTGGGIHGFECTFGVDSLPPIIAAVEANGGAIDMSEYRIEGVGNLIYFIDTEGNRVGAMKYDDAFEWPAGTCG
jgi:predicted enzyme related to lactoylglutathione lyase